MINSKDQGHVPFYRNDTLVTKYPSSGDSSDGKISEKVPLLGKEMTMERSRSAPFSGLHSATSRTASDMIPVGQAATNAASLNSFNKTCTLLKTSSSSSSNKSAIRVSNPLVQGYHLLCETSI